MVQTKAKRKVAPKASRSKSTKRPKVAIVVSLFNEEVCKNLVKGSLDTLQQQGYALKDIEVFEVAGAYEIPLVAQKLLTGKKKRDGVVALGCVIRGDTPHFEYVCEGVTHGCMQAQLTAGKPIALGVITVNTEDQALERSQPNEFNKGREAALALIDTFETLRSMA